MLPFRLVPMVSPKEDSTGSSRRATRDDEAAQADPVTPTVRTGMPPQGTGRDPLFTRGELVAERFRIVGVLGIGGTGQVFEAEDLLLGRRVALKAIHPDLASDSRSLERLRAEVLLARQVTDPHVCRIFDVARHELGTREAGVTETLVAAMERLEGETLARRLRSGGRLSDDQAARVAEQLARGLAAAHAAGVLHLDFKSGNVLLTGCSEGLRAVITDFGLAVSTRPDGERVGPVRGGTPGYMAPEQQRGERPSPAMDVYAFGCVLHEILTGRLPEASGRVDDRRLPRRWRALLASCLAERPEDRPSDGTAVLRRVRRLTGSAAGRSGARRAAGALRSASLGLLLLTLQAAAPAGPQGAGSLSGSVSPPGAPLADPLLWTRPAEPAVAREFLAGLQALRHLDGRRAQELLASVVEREPGLAVAHAALSEAWAELGHVDRAREAAKRAAELSVSSRGERLFAEARRLEADRAWAEAAEQRRSLHALFPDNPEHGVRRVAVHLAAGAAEEADRVLGTLRQRAPADFEPLLWLLDARVGKAYDDGERQLRSARRAIQAAEVLGQPAVVAHGRLLESQGLRRLGREDQGRAASESSYRLFTDLGNDGGRMRALAQIGLLEEAASRGAEGVLTGYLQALRLAQKLGDAEAEAGLLDRLGAAAWDVGDLDLAEQRYRQARQIYRRLREEAGLARIAGNLALISLSRGDFAGAETAFEEAVRLRRRAGPPSAAALLLSNLGELYARRGEVQRARDTWTEAERLAREGGHLLVAVLAATNLAELALESGDPAEASRILEDEVVPNLDALATPAVTAQAWLLKGAIAFFRGEEGAAVEASARALSTWEELGDPLGAARARLQLAALHAAQGRFGHAEKLAREAWRRLEAAGNEEMRALARYRLLCAILGQGRVGEAGELLLELGDGNGAAGTGDDLNRVLLVALARSRYDVAAGDPETATTELEAALAQLPPRWLVPYRFEARLVLAAAEAAGPNGGESGRLLRELAADAKRDGFVWFAEEASRRLDEATRRPTAQSSEARVASRP